MLIIDGILVLIDRFILNYYIAEDNVVIFIKVGSYYIGCIYWIGQAMI